MPNYLNEAFQKLSLLEDENPASEIDWKEKVAKYLEDDVDAPEEEEIIDPEANTEADLQDSYVGKVIIECNSCHTRLYKDQEDLVNEEGILTIGEPCPVCNQDVSGWTVIGKIEPYDADQEFPEDGEPVEAGSDDDIDFGDVEGAEPVEGEDDLDGEEDVEFEDEEDDDEFGEAFKKAFDEACGEKKLDETACEEGSCADDVCPDCGENPCQCSKYHKAQLEKSNLANDHREQPIDEALTEGDHCCDCEDQHEHNHHEHEDDDIDEAVEGNTKVLNRSWDSAPMEGDMGESLEEGNNPMMDRLRAKMMKMGDVEESCKESLEVNEEMCEHGNENLGVKQDVACEDDISLEDDQKELVKEELHIEASGEDKVNITKNDDGSVNLEVGAGFDEDFVGDPADDIGGEEMIAPVDVEQADEIEAQTGEEEVADEFAEEPIEGEEEMPLEDEIPAEEEEEDMAALEGDEFDDFQEEGFDYLGEAYLRKVYENVNSFKTTDVKLTDGGLIVEGLIKFESGKEKVTEFVFENMQKTKRGKYVFEGLNKTFSNSNKAFILKGDIADKTFVCESMTANYTTKTLNESNESESVRVYERVVVK